MDSSNPHEKRTPKKYTKKLAAFRALVEMIRTEQCEDKSSPQSRRVLNRPRVKR
jgi:hypothetical protein